MKGQQFTDPSSLPHSSLHLSTKELTTDYTNFHRLFLRYESEKSDKILRV